MDFRASERPLWRKADIPEYPQDFHKIDQLGTSALRSEADIQLILVKGSANDPMALPRFSGLTASYFYSWFIGQSARSV